MTKFVWLFVLSLSAQVIKSNQQNEEAVLDFQCIPITECPTFTTLLETKPKTQQMWNLIDTSRCGFQKLIPKVWCPTISKSDEISKTPKFNETDDNKPVTSKSTDEDVDNKPVTSKSTNEAKPREVHLSDSRLKGETKDENKKLFPEKCGGSIQDRIVGGNSTAIDEYPWMALLQYKSSKSNKLYSGCGGALINNRYVLTAAHCLTLGDPPVRVVLGEYDTTTVIDCIYTPPDNESDCAPASIYRGVEKYVAHPDWFPKGDNRPFYNDIALVRLDEPVTFTYFVTPICLPWNDEAMPTNEKFVVAGWGVTEERVQSTVKLQVGLPQVSNEDCTQILGREISDGQLCAGGVAGKDACRGDSGGPLMRLNYNSNIWTLTGIISLDLKGCGVEGYPAIYTFVPKYLDWISETVKP